MQALATAIGQIVQPQQQGGPGPRDRLHGTGPAVPCLVEAVYRGSGKKHGSNKLSEVALPAQLAVRLHICCLEEGAPQTDSKLLEGVLMEIPNYKTLATLPSGSTISLFNDRQEEDLQCGRE